MDIACLASHVFPQYCGGRAILERLSFPQADEGIRKENLVLQRSNLVDFPYSFWNQPYIHDTSHDFSDNLWIPKNK